jgi:putative (di)nucleoside polyphosphate hydrolase
MMQNKENADDLPYRLGVGMMLINDQNQVLLGKRIDTKMDKWQMPQGGLDEGETPRMAVFREMKEEIGTNNGTIIAEAKMWYCYDIPKWMIPRLWNGQYKGQKQKWFLIKFTGNDSDIHIDTEHQEFKEWKWCAIEEIIDIIIPFKKKLYKAVLKEFEQYLKLKS